MQALYSTLLTTEELTTAAARLSPLWTPLFTGQPLLLAIAAAVETHRDAIVRAASRKAASDFTDPLADGDVSRDAAFTTLRDFSATWAKNPMATAEQRVAGARLQQIFFRHGNTLHRFGYTRQSGKMAELTTELRAAGPTADFTALGLLPLFTQMAAAHEAFEDLLADKAAAEGGESLPFIADHRPELERLVNLLLSNLAAWQELAPTPALEEAIGKIDEVIVQIATPALSRRTKAQPAAPAAVPALTP